MGNYSLIVHETRCWTMQSLIRSHNLRNIHQGVTAVPKLWIPIPLYFWDLGRTFAKWQTQKSQFGKIIWANGCSIHLRYFNSCWLEFCHNKELEPLIPQSAYLAYLFPKSGGGGIENYRASSLTPVSSRYLLLPGNLPVLCGYLIL